MRPRADEEPSGNVINPPLLQVGKMFSLKLYSSVFLPFTAKVAVYGKTVNLPLMPLFSGEHHDKQHVRYCHFQQNHASRRLRIVPEFPLQSA